MSLVKKKRNTRCCLSPTTCLHAWRSPAENPVHAKGSVCLYLKAFSGLHVGRANRNGDLLLRSKVQTINVGDDPDILIPQWDNSRGVICIISQGPQRDGGSVAHECKQHYFSSILPTLPVLPGHLPNRLSVPHVSFSLLFSRNTN